MKKQSKPVDPPSEAEAEFLAGYDMSAFPRPSVAVDVAVVTASGGRLQAVLYLRHDHPSKGRYALPGGFVRMDESLDEAAARLLRDKAGLRGVFLEQLYTFGDPGRDPRGRIITVAYLALVEPARLAEIDPARGARAATLVVPWEGEAGGPVEATDEAGRRLPLAFDHAEVLGAAIKLPPGASLRLRADRVRVPARGVHAPRAPGRARGGARRARQQGLVPPPHPGRRPDRAHRRARARHGAPAGGASTRCTKRPG